MERAFRPVQFLTLIAAIAGLTGCQQEETRFGKPIEPHRPVGISELLANADQHLNQVVVVEGQIGEVCQSVGCWCFIREGEDQLYVSMTTFTLPTNVSGSQCRAKGKLVMRSDRLTLLATGIELLEA
jgi:hypothetical protein